MPGPPCTRSHVAQRLCLFTPKTEYAHLRSRPSSDAACHAATSHPHPHRMQQRHKHTRLACTYGMRAQGPQVLAGPSARRRYAYQRCQDRHLALSFCCDCGAHSLCAIRARAELRGRRLAVAWACSSEMQSDTLALARGAPRVADVVIHCVRDRIIHEVEVLECAVEAQRRTKGTAGLLAKGVGL